MLARLILTALTTACISITASPLPREFSESSSPSRAATPARHSVPSSSWFPRVRRSNQVAFVPPRPRPATFAPLHIIDDEDDLNAATLITAATGTASAFDWTAILSRPAPEPEVESIFYGAVFASASVPASASKSSSVVLNRVRKSSPTAHVKVKRDMMTSLDTPAVVVVAADHISTTGDEKLFAIAPKVPSTTTRTRVPNAAQRALVNAVAARRVKRSQTQASGSPSPVHVRQRRSATGMPITMTGESLDALRC